MEDYVNQVKNICSQTVHNDKSEFDNVNILLQTIFTSVLDKENFAKYNHDNPTSSHWKLFTVIAIFAKTNNKCLFPNENINHLKVLNHWCLNRLLQLALMDNVHKISPQLSQTCGAILQFIERHDALTATDIMQYFIQAFTWIVHATEKRVENVDIPWLQYGDKTELIPIPGLGNVGLNFKRISMRGRENMWSVGSVICELISLLPGMILSNEELAFDDLVRNIKVFVMEGDFYAQTAGLEALNALLYRGGTYMLRCRTASNLQLLANFLLFELRSSRRVMPKMWGRRFNKALCSFISYLSNVEDVESVSLAQQCLCVLLTRNDDEMEQFAALRPYLKALPRFSKHLFHLLLKQLVRCRQRSEDHIEICAQLIFDELSADLDQKTPLFFAFWEEALVLRETIPIEETLTPVFTAALAWSRLLRQKPCSTPTGLFSLLMEWATEFLNLFHRQQEADKWSPVQRWCLATYVRTLQAVACVETSVDRADERRNEREEIHRIVGIFVSPFLECLTVQNLLGVASKPKLKDLLLSVGSHLKREGLTEECIIGLALVTGRTELQLQELIFRRCLQNASMLESAFRCLPFLAVKIGSDQPNVWTDLLVVGLASIKKRPASVLTLLPHIGRLPCLLTGFLEIQYSAEKVSAVHILDHLACAVCDGKEEMEDSQGGKALPLELLGDVVDFLLDRESDEQIVIDGVDVLRRILRHIDSDGTPIGPTIKCFHRSLELLQHPSFRVRLVFSEILPDLYRAMLTNPKCHELWNRLVKSFQSLLESENAAEVDTAVVTACNLSGICREDHFSQLVPCVMLAGVVRRHGLRGLLWDGIKTIMRTREVNSFQLVAICRSNIAKTLVAFLYRIEELGQRATLDSCAATWATFLRIQKMEFFQSIFQDLFLEFVMRCDAVAHRYIQEMMSSASWLEHTEYLDRLCESRVLPETFVALFSRCSDHPSALTPHYNFLSEHCKSHVERIATFNDVTRLIHQLLLRLDGTNNPGLIGGLRWVFTDVLRAGHATNLSYAQLMELLQSYFYGALVKMDHVLLQEDATARERLGVLLSFSATLKMFNEKAITEHRMKILGTLKIGMTLQGNEVADVIIQAWMNFLKVVDRNALSSMITEVVGCLLNFYPRDQQKVSELLRYLIVDNRGQLRAVFKDLHFFPRHVEELQSCRAILDEEIFSEGRNLSSQLTACFGGLAHENADIRRLMLRTLSETLSENLDELTMDTLVEPDAATIQPIIGKLLGLLLQGCKRDGSANAEMRFLYARCLGAIGPLDPGRLPNDVTALVASERESSPAVGHEAVTACADKYFPFEILSQLCRVHLCSYSPKQQEATAVSIQELLKAYNIDRDSIESITSEETEGNALNVDSSQSRQVTGVALWQLFDQSVQQMILPLIRAKYVVSAYTDWSKVTRPIFLRPRIDNHSRWVQLWAASMNQYIDSSANHIFLDCEPVTKTDDSFAQFILPFAFLQVLLDGQTEDVCQLHVEIMAILNSVRVSCQSAGHRARFMRRCPWYRLACQTIFSVLDHCRKWLSQRRSEFIRDFEYGGSEVPDEVLEQEDEQYSKVKRFLESIPHEVQATAALGAGFLTRSLRHYEAGLQAAEGEETLVRGLMEAYTSLRELDGAEGVRKALLSKFTPQEVVEHQRMEATEVRLHYQMMRAEAGPELAEKMFQHDVRDPLRLPTLPVTLETLVDQHPTWNGALNKFRVHAAWKLCQWDQLEQSLEQAHHSDWNVGVGRVMLALQRREPLNFSERLAEAYRQQLDPICASTMQCISYEQVYDNMAKLGALFDIEVMARHALGLNPVGSPLSQDSILKVLNKRLEIGRADQVSQDDRLAIRASLLSLVEWPQCRADTSFKRACLARSGGWYNASMAYLAEAERHLPEMEELALQYCRLYWDQGKKDLAMSALEELVKKQGDVEGNGCQAGETLLFYAHCCDMSGRYAYHETKAKYEQALKLLPASEEAHFRLARYADRTLDRLPVDKSRERHELMCFALRQYGEALCYGSEFVYQSMPRMLTRWLDFGDTVAASMLGPPSAERPVVSSSALVQVQKEMHTNINRIPCHRFYSSFAQLVSGVVNECPEVVGLLIDLIVKVTLAFPNQCMWWLVGLHESKIPARKDKCRIIFELLKKKTQRMANYIKDITAMCGFMKELAEMHHKVKNYPRVMSLASHFRGLLRLVERQHFSSIMIPLHRLMSASLPSATEGASVHSAFPHQLVFLRGFRDRVEILTSLTRPKKVVWKGSDGRDYIMVAKPDDDLRKDSRLMQLNAMINRWLLLNPETRSMIQTSMIRCFAVITLGENGGLIEWVEKTTGYKNMVLELYRERNISYEWSFLQQIGPHLQDSHEVKLQKFREKVYKLFKPPVFHLWFLRQFPDTNAWFQARSRYTRSAAVMSMVGYIIGLGDRHGENILFDCTNGEVVHCDFNCIFNKGKTYKWPEVVPFRLTHNMLAAFGPTGYEGLFRKCCEAVMKLMREKVDSMLAVFRPAIVDMMLETPSEWFPNERRTEPAIRRKCAFAKLNDVEHRLQGRMTDDAAVNQLPMSAEGQVETLLRQATDERLLCLMYIGWAPFL